VGYMHDRGASSGEEPDSLGKVVDCDLAVVADVEHLTDGGGVERHGDGSPYGVGDVSEAAGLPAGAVDGDRLPAQGLPDKPGNHHAVAAGLSRADRVEIA